MDVFRRELLTVRLELLEAFDQAYASLMRDFRRNCPAACETWTLDSPQEFLVAHHVVLEPEVLEALIRGLIFSKLPNVRQAYERFTTPSDATSYTELMTLPARYRLMHLLTKMQVIAGVAHDGNGGFPIGHTQLFFTPSELTYALFRCAGKVVVRYGKMYAICGHEYRIADYTILWSPSQRPYQLMFHGTFRSNLVGIKEKGLLPMTKDCIYFSSVWPTRGLVPGKGDSPFNAVVIVHQSPLVASGRFDIYARPSCFIVVPKVERTGIPVEALAIQTQNANTGHWEAWEGMPTEAPMGPIATQRFSSSSVIKFGRLRISLSPGTLDDALPNEKVVCLHGILGRSCPTCTSSRKLTGTRSCRDSERSNWRLAKRCEQFVDPH